MFRSWNQPRTWLNRKRALKKHTECLEVRFLIFTRCTSVKKPLTGVAKTFHTISLQSNSHFLKDAFWLMSHIYFLVRSSWIFIFISIFNLFFIRFSSKRSHEHRAKNKLSVQCKNKFSYSFLKTVSSWSFRSSRISCSERLPIQLMKKPKGAGCKILTYSFFFYLWESNTDQLSKFSAFPCTMLLAQSVGKNTLHSPIPVIIMYIFINSQLYFHLPLQVKYRQSQSLEGGYLWSLQLHLPLGQSTSLQGNRTVQTVVLGCHSTENTNLSHRTVRQDLIPKRHLFPSELGLYAIFIIAMSFSLYK